MSIDFLSLVRDPNAKYFVVPLVTALLGVAAKVMSSNDKFSRPRIWDYFYLAPNLLVSNFVYICCEFSHFSSIAPSKQHIFSDACVNALIFNIWSTIAITLFIRKFGWNTKDKKLGKFKGIIIPNIVSLIVMIIVFGTLSYEE